MRKGAVESFLHECAMARDGLEKLATELATTRAERRSEAERSVAKLPRHLQSQTRTELLRGIDRESYSAIESDFLAARKKIDDNKDAVRKARAFWSNAVAVLDMETVASPERAAVAANIAHAGPATLKRLAAQAVENKDIAVGAAVIARVESLLPSERPVDIHELAAALAPPHAAEILERLRLAELNVLHAEAAADEIRPSLGTARIERGMRMRELAQPKVHEAPAQSHDRTSLEKISAGITAREGAKS